MKPKDKAKELVEKMYVVHSHSASDITYYFVKECALIAVDELIYETQFEVPNIRQRYWLEVKQEIEKL